MDNTIYDALYFFDELEEIISYDNSTLSSSKSNYYDKDTDFTCYNFYTNKVPRVSNILAETIYDKSLSDWFKFTDYKIIKAISSNALKVGSFVHEGIEKFLMIGEEAGNEYISHTLSRIYDNTIYCSIVNAYNNFKLWYMNMTNKGYKIEPICCERATVNPWFGGTIDCIMRITDNNGNSNVYIIDFKTSKKITINYYLQTYAYYWSLTWEKNNIIHKTDIPNIDGIGIIRIDKSKYNNYDFSTIDFRGPDDIVFLSDLRNAFISMIEWYYHKKRLEIHFKLN